MNWAPELAFGLVVTISVAVLAFQLIVVAHNRVRFWKDRQLEEDIALVLTMMRSLEADGIGFGSAFNVAQTTSFGLHRAQRVLNVMVRRGLVELRGTDTPGEAMYRPVTSDAASQSPEGSE